jgi:hypothetical protein
LAEAVVLVWVFGVEEGDLHDGDVEGVCIWIEGYTLFLLVFPLHPTLLIRHARWVGKWNTYHT